MTNIIIIGASGSLAGPVIEELQKNKDVHLTLFLRSKSRLHNPNLQNVTIMEGDVMDYAALKAAIQGQDIAYVNLAGNLEAMATKIVKAMKETGVQRIIAISSIGIYGRPLKQVLVPYRKLADVIEASGLDYTILRPDWFTNTDEVDYELTRKGEPEKGQAISRKSIAAFITEIIKAPEKYSRENLGIAKPGA
ncbi:MAG: NAD(P)H-binding protein [Flavisolibacter sp.]